MYIVTATWTVARIDAVVENVDLTAQLPVESVVEVL